MADLIRNPASTLLPNLDRAPIVLDAMVLQDTVTTAEELQSAIKLSYKSALLRQFYKLLLRVDMLSVPVRLVSGVGQGVRDFGAALLDVRFG